jgi:hypothetical protein
MHRPSHERGHFRWDVGHPTVGTIDSGGSVPLRALEVRANQGTSDSNGGGQDFSCDRAYPRGALA